MLSSISGGSHACKSLHAVLQQWRKNMHKKRKVSGNEKKNKMTEGGSEVISEKASSALFPSQSLSLPEWIWIVRFFYFPTVHRTVPISFFPSWFLL